MADRRRSSRSWSDPWGARREPTPLKGGITNRNFRLRLGERDYVLRLAVQDAELLGIDRRAERMACQTAAQLGPPPLRPPLAGGRGPETGATGCMPRPRETPDRARGHHRRRLGGASIAYHLTQIDERNVVLLDRHELTSGFTFHSAGLVGQLRGVSR